MRRSAAPLGKSKLGYARIRGKEEMEMIKDVDES